MQLSSKLDLQDTWPVVYHTLSARMPSHFSLRTFSSAALTQGDVTDRAPRCSESWPSVLPVNCPFRAVSEPALSTRIWSVCVGKTNRVQTVCSAGHRVRYVFDTPQFPGRYLAANGVKHQLDASVSEALKQATTNKRIDEVKTREGKLNL